KVVQTIHGLDPERAKWGPVARFALRRAEWVSGHVPDATIAVSDRLVDYMRRRYGREATLARNGVEPGIPLPDGEISRRWRLAPRRYILFVGRLVPEKGVDLLLRAFKRVQ